MNFLGSKLKGVMDKIRGTNFIDEKTIKEVIKEMQRALIQSDVNIKTVLEISKKIEKKALKQKALTGISGKEQLVKIFYDELVKVLGGELTQSLEVQGKKILLVGIFGAGKTTTTAKLGKYYSKRGLKVGLIGADVWRPAAFEQLKQNAEKINVPYYGEPENKDPIEIINHGLDKFNDTDLTIVDSAGRHGLDEELIVEIKDIKKTLQPDEIILVLSADMGQSAGKQAQLFHDALGITGVIVTKMDGSSKGGGVLSACSKTESPVYFIGTGEKLDDIEEFDANRYLSRIMGYGDLEGLIEKVNEISAETDLSPEEMLKGDFTLKMFYDQLEAAKKMGPLNKVVQMMGLGGQVDKSELKKSEERLKRFKYIIDSMTTEETINSDILNKSRIIRISKGSGTKPEQIRELLREFKKTQKMMKMLKKGKRGPLGGLMKQFEGQNLPEM